MIEELVEFTSFYLCYYWKCTKTFNWNGLNESVVCDLFVVLNGFVFIGKCIMYLVSEWWTFAYDWGEKWHSKRQKNNIASMMQSVELNNVSNVKRPPNSIQTNWKTNSTTVFLLSFFSPENIERYIFIEEHSHLTQHTHTITLIHWYQICYFFDQSIKEEKKDENISLL